MVFEYPGRLPPTSFRLLRILPARDALPEQVRVQLETYEINKAPRFCALSYTWGFAKIEDQLNADEDASLKQPRLIEVNGQPFDVFPNLFFALVQLSKYERRASNNNIFWIDAICINQADVAERTDQVCLMDQIFAKATNVLAWLGTADEYTERVCEVIAQLSKRQFEFPHDQDEEEPDLNNPDVWNELGITKYDPLTSEAISSFFNRLWFSRVWIIQEVALAQNLMMLWGTHSLSWWDLVHCTDFLVRTTLHMDIADLRAEHIPTDSHARQVGKSVPILQSIATLCKKSHRFSEHKEGLITSDSIDSRTLHALSSSSQLLLILLNMSRFFDATNDHDVLYSLFGIVEKVSKNMSMAPLEVKPDYELPTAEIYQRITVELIERLQCLDVLGLVPHQKREKFACCPSWVPDFASRGPNPMGTRTTNGPFSIMQAFQAAGEDKNVPSIFATNNALHVQASIVASVNCIGDTQNSSILDGIYVDSARLLLQLPMVYSYTGQPRVEAFWRTMIMDDLYNTPHTLGFGTSFRYFLQHYVLNGLTSALDKGTYRKAYEVTARLLNTIGENDSTQTLSRPMDYTSGIIEYDRDLPGLIVHKTKARDALGDWKPKAALFHTALSKTSPHRRLFATSQHHLGFGHESVLEGDMLTLVQGSRFPSILRPVEGEDAQFSFVGEAYVHGFMNRADRQGREWRSIEIV